MMMIRSNRLLRRAALCVTAALALEILFCGCRRMRDDLDYSYEVEQTWTDAEDGITIVQFQSVPWNPLATETLRQKVRTENFAASRKVLDIGAGTGLFALACARNAADHVTVAVTDPAAEACVRYNVAAADLDDTVTVRQMSAESEAADFDAAVPPGKTFDRIVIGSEMPLSEFLPPAIFAQLTTRLAGGGECWVICHDAADEAVVRRLADDHGFAVLDIDGKPSPPEEAEEADRPARPIYPKTLRIDPYSAAGNSEEKDSEDAG